MQVYALADCHAGRNSWISLEQPQNLCVREQSTRRRIVVSYVTVKSNNVRELKYKVLQTIMQGKIQGEKDGGAKIAAEYPE